MRHVYIDSENLIYSFGQNNLVKTSISEPDKSYIKNGHGIAYVDQNPIFYAVVALTNHCNLICKHCAIKTTQIKANCNELSDQTLIDLTQSLYKQGLVRVAITGGEPLLYPKLVDAFDLLHKHHIESRINTNGILLSRAIDQGIIEKLIDCGLTEIDVSLNDPYGDSDTYHNRANVAQIRLQNIRKLTSIFGDKVKITVSTVLTRKMIDYLPQVESILYDVGINEWRLRELLISDTEEIPSECYPEPEKLVKKMTEYVVSSPKIHVFGYLYDTIVGNKVFMRCSNIEDRFVFVDSNRDIYWTVNIKLGRFDGSNMSQIAQTLTQIRLKVTVPQKCDYCSARNTCLISPYAYEEIKEMRVKGANSLQVVRECNFSQIY